MTDFDPVLRLSHKLEHKGETVAAEASKVVREAALMVESTAKRLAPVDTGNLRNSIGTDAEPGELTATVGPTAAYGVYVEFGTSRMGPQPFMGPALEAVKPQFTKRLREIGGDL